MRAVRGFCLVDSSLSAGFCLGLQVSSPSFHSPRPRSLSLSALLAPASRPWGYSWLAPVSVLATFVARVVPLHLLVAYLLVSLRFCTVLFRSLFPTFLVESSSSAFPWRPSSPFLLVCPGRWLIFLALSSAFCQVIVRCLLSSLWFGWCFCYLPCGPAPGLSLACWLFHRFFSQSLSLYASWTLEFLIPLPFPSSWAPLSQFSSSAASSSPRYSWWRLDPAFLLLWCASSYSLSRLVFCFCFLGRLFRALSRFRGFLS